MRDNDNNNQTDNDDDNILLLESPTHTTVATTTTATLAMIAPPRRFPSMKLADVNRSVTHPIQLLHENLMLELFQEQLRVPSPVRQSDSSLSLSVRSSSSNNNRPSPCRLPAAGRTTIHIRTSVDSRTSGIATSRRRQSAATGPRSNNNTIDRSSIDSSSSYSHRLSLPLQTTPRPTIVLYGTMSPSTVAVSHHRRPSSVSTTSDTNVDAALAHLDAMLPLATRLLPRATLDGFAPLAAAAPQAAGRECQICFDKMDALQAHVCVVCTSACCSTCLQWYIEFKIHDGDVSRHKLVCPAPGCVRPLPEELIEAFATRDVFAKYKLFLRNQRAGVRFCPQAGCAAALDEPLFTTSRRGACATCQTTSCMRCGDVYHPRLQLCRRRVDKRYSHWKRHHNVRACPSCNVDIEKQGGCSHMKCFQCDQEFCWSCLRSWDRHDETLCIPLAFYHSRSRKFGCSTPVRFVTKTLVLSVASVAAVAGAGVAVVVLPPVVGYHLVRDAMRRKKHRRDHERLHALADGNGAVVITAAQTA